MKICNINARNWHASKYEINDNDLYASCIIIIIIIIIIMALQTNTCTSTTPYSFML
jgi:hypothetical protein